MIYGLNFLELKTQIIVLVLLASCAILPAQNPCSEAILEGRRLFSQGKLSRAIEIATPCINSKNIARPIKRELLNLIIEAYIFRDENEKAEEAYEELLGLDPFNRFDQNIPELVYLREAFETYPVFSLIGYGGFHFFTRPTVQQQYEVGNVIRLDEKYQFERGDALGYTLGVNANLNLFRSNFDLMLGLGFSRINFRHTRFLENVPGPDGSRLPAQLSLVERQGIIQLPLALSYNFVEKGKVFRKDFIPYVFAGVVFEFLQKESASFLAPTLSYTEVDSTLQSGIINIQEQRRKSNVSLLAGLGVKMHIKRFFVDLNIRYTRSLNNVAKPEGRFDNTLLVEQFFYLDNDFLLNHFTGAVGVGYFFFKSKKKP